MVKVSKLPASSHMSVNKSPSLSHRCRHGHHFSRRDFLRSGAAFMALAAGLGRINGAAFAGSGSGIPTQLPGFSPVLKDLGLGEIPFYLPVEIDPFLGVFDPVQVPSTMWDFKGLVAMAEVEGVSHPANNSDGVARTWAVDFRYMDGMFIDREGNRQRGTFGFF